MVTSGRADGTASPGHPCLTGDVETEKTVTSYDCALGSTGQETVPQLLARRPLGCTCLPQWSFGSYGISSGCANPGDEWPMPWCARAPCSLQPSCPHDSYPYAHVPSSTFTAIPRVHTLMLTIPRVLVCVNTTFMCYPASGKA